MQLKDSTEDSCEEQPPAAEQQDSLTGAHSGSAHWGSGPHSRVGSPAPVPDSMHAQAPKSTAAEEAAATQPFIGPRLQFGSFDESIPIHPGARCRYPASLYARMHIFVACSFYMQARSLLVQS